MQTGCHFQIATDASVDDEEGEHKARYADEECEKLTSRTQYTPEETLIWLQEQIRLQPVYQLYPELAEKAIEIIGRWQARFEPRVWARYQQETALVFVCYQVECIIRVEPFCNPARRTHSC